MEANEARRIAELSAPNDPQQQAITEAALREVGERAVTVQFIEDGDPAWQAVFTDTGDAVTFAGLFIYGGDTREEALEAARRIAGKWDWQVIE